MEIKTTLQNKLHRSAGPEDLVTAQRIFDKVKSYCPSVFTLSVVSGPTRANSSPSSRSSWTN